MIAEVFPGGNAFKPTISYLETGEEGLVRKEDRVAWTGFWNLPTRNSEVAACMMRATANASVSNTQEPVYHFSVSLHPDDPGDEPTLRKIADRTIRDLGLGEYEVIVVAHKDRSHPHLHFVVNRVHPERGTLWSPWRDYYRLERSMRAQEKEFGLQVVPGHLVPVYVLESAEPGQEEKLVRLRPRSGSRRGDAAFVADVTERATPVLQHASSWAELERGLAEQGLSIRVKGGGITLTDGRQEAKASQVGRAFSRGNLEKRFGRYPDYRARMAVANALAPARQVALPVREQPQAGPEASRPVAKPAPAPSDSASAAEPKLRAHPRGRPQFGDAGHGIAELFGGSEGPIMGRRAPSAEQQPTHAVEGDAVPDPQPTDAVEQGGVPEPPRLGDPQTRFLRDVQARVTPVLRRARSWMELERGLADHGLSLLVKGGGFVLTDGERQVKASEVGRTFSRFHLEKRLGLYPDPATPAATPTPEAAPPPVTIAPVRSQPTPAPAPPVIPEPRSPATAPPPAEVRTERSKARQDIRAEQHELPFADSLAPPAPVRPPSHPASAQPEPPARRPAERAPRPPEPVRADPPRAPRPEPVEPAVPAPLPAPAPDLTGPLRDLVQRGLAIEEAEREVEDAGKEVHAAEDALAMIPERAKRADAARDNAAERLGEVYADPKAALKAITAYRQQRGDQALLSAVKATPQQFGALPQERGPRLFGIFFRMDTTSARQTAPLLAIGLKHYYATPAPSPEERTAAWQRVLDARSVLEAAQQARSTLPPGHSSKYRRELADVFRGVAAEVPGGAERLARLITTTIPSAGRFVAGALDAVHDEERRRERERGRGRGIDF